MNNNSLKDGIRYPSIDQLVQLTHSKYKLVVGVAKRAKALSRKENPAHQLIDHPHSKKAIGIALEEVVEGKIKIVDISKQLEEENKDNTEE